MIEKLKIMNQQSLSHWLYADTPQDSTESHRPSSATESLVYWPKAPDLSNKHQRRKLP